VHAKYNGQPGAGSGMARAAVEAQSLNAQNAAVRLAARRRSQGHGSPARRYIDPHGDENGRSQDG
jgi:hypothetical protein